MMRKRGGLLVVYFSRVGWRDGWISLSEQRAGVSKLAWVSGPKSHLAYKWSTWRGSESKLHPCLALRCEIIVHVGCHPSWRANFPNWQCSEQCSVSLAKRSSYLYLYVLTIFFETTLFELQWLLKWSVLKKKRRDNRKWMERKVGWEKYRPNG